MKHTRVTITRAITSLKITHGSDNFGDDNKIFYMSKSLLNKHPLAKKPTLG
jgi:hypothetical protein